MLINILQNFIIILVLGIFLLSFFKKYKSNDNSFSFKFIYFVQKEYPLIILFILIYIIFNYFYIISRFSNISIKLIITCIWNQWNYLLRSFTLIFNKIFNRLIEIQILKTIVIGYFATKILNSENLFTKFTHLISMIKEITYKGVSLKIKEAEEAKLAKEAEINTIKMNSSKGNINTDDANKQIEKVKIKKEILATMIDSNKIVEYINRFINRETTCIRIPKNIIPNKITLGAIDKMFKYKVGHNCIELLGIKDEIIKPVIETFNELKDKGIIYCK